MAGSPNAATEPVLARGQNREHWGSRLGVILAVAALLGEMGEPPERSPLKWVALGVGILWVVDLICLVLAQALNSLAETDEEQ